MAHKEQLSNILSYLDNVEDDDNAPFDNKQTIKERKINTASSTTTTKRFIWDDWDEESLSSSHNQQNQAEDGYNFDDDISAQSPLSTISPESSRRKNNNNNNFISPIIHNDHKTQQTNSSLGHENSTISSSVTAVAFRDVQSKIQAMQSELDQRSEEVLCKEKELHNVRLAAEASRTALINSWKAKNEDAEITAQAALDRQREFQHRLVVDVDKLKNKQEELSEQVSRVIRRREGEIAAAKRNIISNLRSEREAWVSNERGKLARLAESKADSMKASAVESLEPVLTELIRNQRLEMRDLEIKLKDKFGLTIRQHKIRLQKDKDEMTASIESRFNAAMLRQREVWSEEFREAMAKCEEDALKLRQDHDQAMMNDRASHDHMWRQLMANKEAEVEEVRVEASAKASKLVQEHSKYMTELAEKQKTSLRVASKARLLNEENFKKRVLDEIAEDRAKLDAKVLAQVKAKANRELETVEERLNRQFREELSHLEGEMIEKKSKLTTELDERLKNIKFNHFGNLKSRNNPKKNSNKNDNKNDIDDEDDEEDDEDLNMIVEQLKLQIEKDNNEIIKLDSDIQKCQKTKEEEKIKLESMNKQIKVSIEETMKQCGLKDKKGASEALAVMRRKEALLEENKIIALRRRNEIDELKQVLAEELTAVRTRVDAVLRRKEEKAADLADQLAKLTKLNDDRNKYLNELRMQKFVN